MKHYFFIINPATKKAHKVTENLIKAYFPEPDYKIEIQYSKNYQHIRELTKQALALNVNAVVSVGGLGTANAIIQELKYTETPIALIPTGANNAFAFTIQIKTIKQGLQALKDENISKVDLGKVSHNSIGDIFFMGFCAQGLSPIAFNTLQTKEKKGYIDYLIAILKNVRQYKPKSIQIRFNFFEKEERFFELFIGNISNYGRRSKFTDYTSTRDGLIDIILAKEVSILRLFKFLILTQLGFVDDVYDIIEHKKSEVIDLFFYEKTKMHIDFEVHSFQGQVTIEAIPKAIRVILPKDFILK